MTSTRVCVLGSANMDLVVTVERAPTRGETVTGRDFVQSPGGKGANQALAAARSGRPGGSVHMLGAVGKDAFGATIRELLEGEGVDASGLVTVQQPTGTAHIVVDAQGENSIVVIPGANGTVGSLTDHIRKVIASSDMLVMQLELPLEVVEEAAGWAHGQGTRVMLTPAPVLPVPDSLLANVDLLVCNEHEVVQLADEPDIVAAARALLGRGPSSVVVTCGAQGCLHVGRGTAPVEVAAPRVQAVDTTAAGDTFAGCLAVALCEGRGVGDSLRWATAAAAMSVQRAGASGSMPHRWELDNFHASLDDGCEG